MDISQFKLHAKIEDIHWWFRARRQIIFDQLKEYVPTGKGKVVAEIGCGTGGNLKLLKDHYQVIGVDTSPEAVRYAMERVNCKIFLSDFRDALFESWGDLDAVVLADVLEHISDHKTFIRDLVTYLRPGAVLVITVPAHQWIWSQHDVILGHKRRYSAKGLRSLWENLPVTELTFSPFNCILSPIIFLYRLLRFGGHGPGCSDLYLPSPVVNDVLYKIFSAERPFLKLFPLPWGVSYLATLKKVGQS
jgi:SAM-dependent methyltransferase